MVLKVPQVSEELMGQPELTVHPVLDHEENPVMMVATELMVHKVPQELKDLEDHQVPVAAEAVQMSAQLVHQDHQVLPAVKDTKDLTVLQVTLE